MDLFCRKCHKLDRTTSICDKYREPLQVVIVGREKKYLKCQKCAEMCVGTNATMIWEKEKVVNLYLENPLHTPET